MLATKAESLNGHKKVGAAEINTLLGWSAPSKGITEWSSIEEITPEFARELQAEYAYSRQRRLSQQHVDFLAFEMAGGRFQTSEIRIVHGPNGAYLTNGQHRLAAVIQSGVTIKANIYHSIVQSESEIAADYGNTDIGKKRTVNDALSATDIFNNCAMGPTKFNAIGAAVKPIIGGFTPSSFGGMSVGGKSIGIRVNAIRDWMPEAALLFEAVEGGTKLVGRRFLGQPVLSVALVTVRYQRKVALEFWRAVTAQDGLHKGDPRRALAIHLSEHEIRSSVEYARRVATCWNAHQRGRVLNFAKLQSTDRPILIEGTPYDGKSVKTVNYGDEAAQ